jgi:hypothetical protein
VLHSGEPVSPVLQGAGRTLETGRGCVQDLRQLTDLGGEGIGSDAGPSTGAIDDTGENVVGGLSSAMP